MTLSLTLPIETLDNYYISSGLSEGSVGDIYYGGEVGRGGLVIRLGERTWLLAVPKRLTCSYFKVRMAVSLVLFPLL